MQKIPLTQGQYAIVDDADLARIMEPGGESLRPSCSDLLWRFRKPQFS
jgi:hypothetical protein